MKQFAVTAFFLTIGAILASTAWSQPLLRDHVFIEEDVIRLGDLFTDAGEKGEITIAKAPAPGARIVLDADRLYRIAKAYRLPWQMQSRFDRIVIERTSTAVPREEILEALRDSLNAQGLPKEAKIEIANANLQIHVPANQPATIAVKYLQYDKRTQYFSALMVSPANDPLAKEFQVSGRAYATIPIPVLREHANAGDIIRKEDIEWIQMRADRVSSNAVTSAEGLIGNTPRRVIMAGKSIPRNDVRPPVLVAKGDTVTITYETPSMTLRTKGRAMDVGGQNDTIRVMNTQSKFIVDATVTGRNMVSVDIRGPIATSGGTGYVR